MYNAIEAGLLSSIGVNTWMPIATAANVAQGAAALAIAVKTRNKKTKSMALPAALSAMLEHRASHFRCEYPFHHSLCLRMYRRSLRWSGCFPASCGRNGLGITGLFGFLITTSCAAAYALVMAVAAGVAFALSWVLYKE